LRSRILTNVLLAVIAIGVLGYLGWTIHRDRESAKEARQIAMAQERIRIWNSATGNDLVSALQLWLEQQTGKQFVSLDHVYARDFRTPDVNWNAGRDASVTGILTVQGASGKNPAFYLSWKQAMHLQDDGSWRSDKSTFQLLHAPYDSQANNWRSKVLLAPRLFREPGIE
jgi:hypothetical protein